MAHDIAFWVLAVVAVTSAVMIVLLRNIFRAALAMVLCFTVIAGLYATLGADFLAVIQILIYVGAISVMIILAIMLTQDVWQAGKSSIMGGPAFVAFLLFGAVFMSGLSLSKWKTVSPQAPQPTIGPLGLEIFGRSGFALPLLISAVMLLAAIIGALSLIREDQHKQ